MKYTFIGQIQKPFEGPENVRLIVDSDDPMVFKSRVLNVSSDSGTLTIDLGESNYFAATLTENVTTFDINGPMKANERWDWEIQLTQDSTARTVAVPSGAKFVNGTAFSMPTGSGDIIKLKGYTIDGGTTHICDFPAGPYS